MRLTYLMPIVAAGLLGPAAIAHAEIDTATKLRLQSIEARLPDADKLAELERKVDRIAQAKGIDTGEGGGGASGPSLFSLLQDVQGLKEDVRRLRGELDQLKHDAEQRQQRQRDLYQDLDGRLQALEQQAGISGAQGGGSAGTGSADAGAVANPAQVKQAYQAALDQLKQGQYSASVKSFDAFLKQYPRSEYSDNAWYWLGEAHYVDREYEPALSAFNHVLDDFPQSGKAPGALYKIGVIHDEQGNPTQARQTLQKMIQSYPQDDAADMARKRLQAIGGASGNGGGN